MARHERYTKTWRAFIIEVTKAFRARRLELRGKAAWAARARYILKYRKEHPDKVKAWAKKQNDKPSRRASMSRCTKVYGRKNIKKVVGKYLGVQQCPKCGKKGYPTINGKLNTKTGHESKPCVIFRHTHTANGISIYYGCCYVNFKSYICFKSNRKYEDIARECGLRLWVGDMPKMRLYPLTPSAR